MENEELILGYQWSPENNRYAGEYRFPNNKDKEEIYMPPFTTLVSPPETKLGFCPYWNGNEWFIDIDPNAVTEHPPIDDYEMVMPDYIDYLKSLDLWTEDDENKRKTALDNIKKREEEEENAKQNIDYEKKLRSIRNNLLYDSDWTQLPDAPLSEEQKELWSIYRQNLRDLPSVIEDPKPLVLDRNHLDWPTPPS
jgi:hypothetical protein